MMRTLESVLDYKQLKFIEDNTRLVVKGYDKLETPEALLIHQQSFLTDDTLFDLCCQHYNEVLQTPHIVVTPDNIVKMFDGYDVVVIEFDEVHNHVTLGKLPESVVSIYPPDGYSISFINVPIYYFSDVYYKQHKAYPFLAEMPVIDIWDMIVAEALELGASDITLSASRSSANVYYNVRKRKVKSKRYLEKKSVEDVVRHVASDGGSTIATTGNKPRYLSVTIGKHHRARVVINKNYFGYMLTARILDNEPMNVTLEGLNLSEKTIEFLRTHVLSYESGMRLFIGETMSGKNTTTLATLREIVQLDKFKIVSVEQPVEIFVDGIEQIHAETDDEFVQAADSLLRQNPDVVYFTEITERTAQAIIKQCNTSKAVYTTVHANSISEVLFRLNDITHMDIDRLILTLHSCIYQKLERDEATDTVHPVNVCVYFSDELKADLYGKPMAYIIKKLKELEDAWKGDECVSIY